MSRADEHDGPPVEPGLLHAYLDGELPADEARRVEAQIASSAAAQRQLEAARLERALADDLLAMVELDPPVQVPEVTTVLDRGTDAERAAASLATDAHDGAAPQGDLPVRPMLRVERGGAGADAGIGAGPSTPVGGGATSSSGGADASRVAPLAWPPRGAWRWAAAVLLMIGGTWLLTPRAQREVPGAVIGEAAGSMAAPATSATPGATPMTAAVPRADSGSAAKAAAASDASPTRRGADAEERAFAGVNAATDVRALESVREQSKVAAAEQTTRAERALTAAASSEPRATDVPIPASPPPPPPPSAPPAVAAPSMAMPNAPRPAEQRMARRAVLPRPITLDEARALLGREVSQITGRVPSRVELVAEEPALVRLVYVDATGAEIVLDQEPVEAAPRGASADPLAGRARRADAPIRWTSRGLRLQLDGTVSQDSLARVRARVP
jgi:anti-sigma factor RsiW